MWKRTTTYTMLKRLCERKIFENSHGTVRALMKREEFLGSKYHLNRNIPIRCGTFD